MNSRGSPYIALICQGAWGVTLLLLPFSSFSSLLDYFGPVCILSFSPYFPFIFGLFCSYFALILGKLVFLCIHLVCSDNTTLYTT